MHSQITVSRMSSRVDTLNTLTEKLKQTINEIQDRYESFIDSNQLYKQGKINEREFFASIGDYLIASSAMNFITVQTIFEMRSMVEKKASTNNQTERLSSPSAAAPSQGGIGISSFTAESQIPKADQFSLPKPQQPTFKALQTHDGQGSVNSSENVQKKATKDCTVCGKAIPKQAKFCSRCGNSQ
jgi:hypothetical protein